VERLLAEQEPEIIGLSIMTFQRKTAKGIIDLVRMGAPARAKASTMTRLIRPRSSWIDWTIPDRKKGDIGPLRAEKRTLPQRST
jgi:hypothetical protein